MKLGYDASTGEDITVSKYVGKYGPKLDGHGKPRMRPIITCPACAQSLHTIGEAILVDATWGHDPAPKRGCPIKDSGAPKYAILAPTHPDGVRAVALRDQFFKNWRLHWGYARTFAPMADIAGLIGFIRHADRINLWAYASLQEWQLPYVFLATCDFPPPKGKAAGKRRDWFRFCFDEKLRTIEDLWIRIIPGLVFINIIYRNPRVGEPTNAHYKDHKSFALNSAWMASHGVFTPHPYAATQMEGAFPAELKP